MIGLLLFLLPLAWCHEPQISRKSVVQALFKLGYHSHEHTDDNTGCSSIDQILNQKFGSNSKIDRSHLSVIFTEVFKNPLPSQKCTQVAPDEEWYHNPWAGSMISVFLITLTSGLGIIFVPLIEYSERTKTFVMVTMIGIAIGALLGDAFLHLIPHALHGHEHSHGTNDSFFSNMFGQATVTSLFILLGVFVFYIADHAMSFFSLGCNHGEESSHDKTAPASVARRHCAEIDSSVEQGAQKCPKPSKISKIKKILPIGWLILFGDALHNFMDGLAIGIGFTTSSGPSGVSTALAVLLHEIPHELADYAILLIAGVPKGKAALLNMASNLTAFIGAATGILLNNALNDGPAKSYATSFTAGGFIYVALADLVPVLIKMQHKQVAKTRDYTLLTVKIGSALVGALLMMILLGFDHAH